MPDTFGHDPKHSQHNPTRPVIPASHRTIAYGCLALSMSLVGSYVALSKPLVAALVGVLVLGETLNSLQLLAFGMALLGMVLATSTGPSDPVRPRL